MKILTDLHTHTVASTHAYSTVLENVAYAKQMGLEAIAITDHAPGIPDGAHRWHFINLRVLPEVIDGVRVLKGAELNIMNLDGGVDLLEEYLKSLDWVIASYHRWCIEDIGTKADRTQCYINLLENPQIDMLGHCGSPVFDFEIEPVIEAAKSCDKVIEINENTAMVRESNIPICRKIAIACAEKGVKISVDSDAHFCHSIGKYPLTEKLIKEIDFPPELIVNKDLNTLREHLNNRGNGKKM